MYFKRLKFFINKTHFIYLKIRTRLIQFSSDPKKTHYLVNSTHTRCGISLQGKQTILHYEEGSNEICPKCQKKSIPKLREWNRRKVIKNGIQAEILLNRLKVLFNIMSQNRRVCIGFHMSTIIGSTSLANWLDNPQPKVEERLEDENKLRISYQMKQGREERNISFNDIVEFYDMVIDELLLKLQRRTN